VETTIDANGAATDIQNRLGRLLLCKKEDSSLDRGFITYIYTIIFVCILILTVTRAAMNRCTRTHDVARDLQEDEEAGSKKEGLPKPVSGLGEDGAHDGGQVGGVREVREAEEAPELLQGHDGGGAAHEADDGGVREEVDEEAEAEDSQRRLEGAREEGGREG